MLNLIFAIAAVLGAGGLWYGMDSFSPWWMLPIALGFYFGLGVLFWLFALVCSFFLPKQEPERSGAFCRVMVGIAMDWLVTFLCTRVVMKGKDRLPREPFVLVSNHRSDFDPIVVFALLRRRKIVYISKESNFKIPIAGPFIRGAGCLAIDRENAMRAMRTLKRAADRLKNEGICIGIYPEGTRSKTGELLEFKTGAFYLAKKAEAPVVVMTTQNTERIAKKFWLCPLTVKLNVLEVISKEEVQTLSMEDLAARTRKTISEGLCHDEVSEN